MKYAIKLLNKRKFILCFIDAFITNLCLYLFPVVLAIFTKQPFTIEKLGYLILSIIGLRLVGIIFNHLWIIYVQRFENQYAKDLQLGYFNRVSKMKPFQLNQIHNGYLKKQIDIIAEESQEFMEYIFETVNGFGISVVIFLIQVIQQDLKMFFFCLAILSAIVIYNIWIGKRYVAIQEEYNNQYSRYNSTYVDFLQNIKTVKRLQATQYANRKNEEAFKKVLPKLDKTNFFYSLRSNGINLFVSSMFVMILINLYIKMKNGQDILSYLLFYATIFSGLTGELKDLARLFIHYNKFQAASKQVEEMIGEEEEAETIRNWNTIEIKDLSFKYNKENRTNIKIPQFSMNRKDKISIVGKSGQGKTTFLNILARYLSIPDNNYIIDGEKKKGNLDLAYISQEIDLFDLTVRENLCLGKEIPEEKLMKYIEEAGLLDWVKGLEKGLDTVVGERGLKLSVGQKQRINLIRGIVLDKEMYILDEPTSNLDKETEKMIVNLIEKYLKEKTVIIVTHREEIKKLCTKHYKFINNTMELDKEDSYSQ